MRPARLGLALMVGWLAFVAAMHLGMRRLEHHDCGRLCGQGEQTDFCVEVCKD